MIRAEQAATIAKMSQESISNIMIDLENIILNEAEQGHRSLRMNMFAREPVMYSPSHVQKTVIENLKELGYTVWFHPKDYGIHGATGQVSICW